MARLQIPSSCPKCGSGFGEQDGLPWDVQINFINNEPDGFIRVKCNRCGCTVGEYFPVDHDTYPGQQRSQQA